MQTPANKKIGLLLCVILAAASLSGAQSLRVLTYNIHHGQNESGQLDIPGLAAYILAQQPDLVALQEVDSACGRSLRVNQMEELGKRTGMYFYFGKAMNYDGGGYGEGILSRLPLTSIKTIQLPTQASKGREPRAAIECTLAPAGGRPFKIIATHLDHLDDETDRLMQARFLADLYAAEPLPFIIAGDLNALPASETMKVFAGVALQPSKDGNAPSWPSGMPEKKIDYILFSKNYGWRCKSFEVLPEPKISDHRPVMAIANLPRLR